jgi:hypothetical protein
MFMANHTYQVSVKSSGSRLTSNISFITVALILEFIHTEALLFLFDTISDFDNCRDVLRANDFCGEASLFLLRLRASHIFFPLVTTTLY